MPAMKITLSAAMRARDVSRAQPAHEAEAAQWFGEDLAPSDGPSASRPGPPRPRPPATPPGGQSAAGTDQVPGRPAADPAAGGKADTAHRAGPSAPRSRRRRRRR